MYDDTTALKYVQRTHNKIIRLVRIKPDVDVDVLMVANQRYYTLDTTVNRIWSAYYFATGPTDYRPLRPKALDELDDENPIWRLMPASYPIWYDERAGQLLLHPMPDTTASAGYPKVTISVQQTDVLTLDSVLPVVDEYDAWVYGTCMRYAREKDTMFMRSSRAMMRSPFPLQVQKYNALWQSALNDLIAWSEGKAVREMHNIQSDIPTPRTV